MKDTLTLELPPQEMQFVWNCLMEAPGKLGYGIAKKFEAQLEAQGALAKPVEATKDAQP